MSGNESLALPVRAEGSTGKKNVKASEYSDEIARGTVPCQSSC